MELKPGHHIALDFNRDGKVSKIIVNNKSKHPNARTIEVEKVDLDHKLYIEGYELDDEETKLHFDVDPKAMFIVDEQETQIAPFDRQFASKTVGQRAMQLFAGPMMNFVLAIFIFLLMGMIQGVPVEEAQMGEVQPESPAEEAGLQENDVITQIGDQSVSTWDQFTDIVRENPDEELDLVISRGDTEEELTVVPAEVETVDDRGDPIHIGQIGVTPAYEKNILGTLAFGFETTYETSKLILNNLVMLVTGQLSIDVLSGPVGIYDATDQVVQSGFTNFLMWTAMLSINLGIINLVPLPALDGGRLMFVGLEAVRGKPIAPEKEGVFHFVGFALLMLLMIVVTWNDIQRLFL